ncbi:MAG: hypothetical protein GF399_09150 [Candidatus Coatesbacteria bacterium]|nr:hypothetical protein [Candidatus Coatesbacteria bacterium]
MGIASCADTLIIPDYDGEITLFQAIELSLGFLYEEGLYHQGDAVALNNVEVDLNQEGTATDWIITIWINDDCYRIMIFDTDVTGFAYRIPLDDQKILLGGMYDTPDIANHINEILSLPLGTIYYELIAYNADRHYPFWRSEIFEYTSSSDYYTGENTFLYIDNNLDIVKCKIIYDYGSIIEFSSLLEADNSFSYIYSSDTITYNIIGNEISETKWNIYADIMTMRHDGLIHIVIDEILNYVNSEDDIYNIYLIIDPYTLNYDLHLS